LHWNGGCVIFFTGGRFFSGFEVRIKAKMKRAKPEVFAEGLMVPFTLT
jgi:hypothetical protein